VELEKREHGFSLYLNGANLDQQLKHVAAVAPQPVGKVSFPIPSTSSGVEPLSKSRPSRTAGKIERMGRGWGKHLSVPQSHVNYQSSFT
jgi:hypothetical protein